MVESAMILGPQKKGESIFLQELRAILLKQAEVRDNEGVGGTWPGPRNSLFRARRALQVQGIPNFLVTFADTPAVPGQGAFPRLARGPAQIAGEVPLAICEASGGRHGGLLARLE